MASLLAGVGQLSQLAKLWLTRGANLERLQERKTVNNNRVLSTELMFYVQLHTKQVILEAFFLANLLA